MTYRITRAAFHVYRAHVADDTLLYVGATNHLSRRISFHRQRSPWYSQADYLAVSHYDTLDEASRVEALVLRQHLPPFNTNHSPYGGAGLIEVRNETPIKGIRVVEQHIEPPTELPSIAGDLMRGGEVIATLGICQSTLSQWVQRGKIQPAQVIHDRLWLYDRADVERLRERTA